MPLVKDRLALLLAVWVDIKTKLPPTSSAASPLLLELNVINLLAVGVTLKLLKFALDIATFYSYARFLPYTAIFPPSMFPTEALNLTPVVLPVDCKLPAP